MQNENYDNPKQSLYGMPMEQPQFQPQYQQQSMNNEINQQQPLIMDQAPIAYQQQPPMQQQQYYANPQMVNPQEQMMANNPQMVNYQMMNQQMMGQQMIMNQQQMMMVPPGMVPPSKHSHITDYYPLLDPNFFGGIQCFYVTDPLAELANAKKASIKQRFEPWEVISGCETPNQYYVFVEDGEGRQKYLFKAKEESNCCCRNFCSGHAREFILHINTIGTQGGKEIKEEFARFNRPFKCTCCCLARPEFIGNYIQKGSSQPNPLQQPIQGQQISQLGPSTGKIIEKFTICDPKIQIYDTNNTVTWTITGDCCQCGYFCRNSICGKCSEVDFEIYKGTGPSKETPPGRIKKKFKGMQSVIGDADFFDLFFPETASPEERFMLVVAIIMLDYMYYEDKENEQPYRSHGYRHHHHF